MELTAWEKLQRVFARAGAKLAFTFEFPYFGSGDTVFTAQSSRQFGADFAQALEAYLFEWT